jgi:DNA polymerase III epsilon subunit-like protein
MPRTASSSPADLAPGVLSWRLRDTPVVAVALETTGFPAGRHRVCELALARIEPGRAPQLTFDSLLSPDRPIAGAEIHGLDDAAVADAPRFADVAADVVDALAGAVVVSFNVAFSLPFLEDELERVGVRLSAPRIGLMFLRPALGLGPRCSLEVACADAKVACERVACARADAEATADLYRAYLDLMTRRGIDTFGELAALGDLPFSSSLGDAPIPDASVLGLGGRCAPVRRVLRSLGRGGDQERLATRRYWNAVTAALADFDLSDAELGLVRRMRELLRLPDERMRAVHARAFLGALATFAGDDWVAAEEVEKLRVLMRSLALLGWSPGG